MLLLVAVLVTVATVHASPQEMGVVGGLSCTIDRYPHQPLSHMEFFNGKLSYLGQEDLGYKQMGLFKRLIALARTRGVPIFIGMLKEAENLQILAGVTDIAHSGGTGQRIDVEKIIMFTTKPKQAFDGDVSIVKLAQDLKFNRFVQPIDLVPVNKEPAAGDTLTVTGWGLTNGGNPRNILQEGNVPVMDRDRCNRIYKNTGGITDYMLCAGGTGIDSCQGDSGGPLINDRGQVVGVVSYSSESCSRPGVPGVYVNMANPTMHKFVEKNM